MANVKISGLSAVTSHASTDLVEIEDTGGTSYKTTLAKLASFLGRWFAGGAPTVASLTSVTGDATSATLTDDSDVGLLIDGGTPVIGDKTRGGELTIASPSADWTWTVRLEGIIPNTNYGGLIVWCRDSSGGKMLTFGYDQTASLVVNRIAALGGAYASTNATITLSGHRPTWFRIKYTNSSTTLTFQASMDGKVWTTVTTETVATYITNKPTRVGVGVTYNRSTGINTVASVGYAKLA